jgi:hypothetical protein
LSAIKGDQPPLLLTSSDCFLLAQISRLSSFPKCGPTRQKNSEEIIYFLHCFKNGVKKLKKTVKKLFIFFTVFYFLHRFQLCTIFYFFSLFLPGTTRSYLVLELQISFSSSLSSSSSFSSYPFQNIGLFTLFQFCHFFDYFLTTFFGNFLTTFWQLLTTFLTIF